MEIPVEAIADSIQRGDILLSEFAPCVAKNYSRLRHSNAI